MKRWMVRGLLSLALCFALPVASADTRLQLVYSTDNPMFSSMLKSLVQRHSLPIDVTYVDNDDLKVFLLQSVQTDTTPELLIMPNDHLGLPLVYKTLPAPWFQRPILKEYLPSESKTGTWGIPIVGGNQLLLYFNKRYVDQPVEDFMRLPEQVGALPNDVDLIRWSVKEPFWFQAFFSVGNQSFFDKGVPSVNTSSMWRGLARYQQLIDLSKADKNCDYSCAYNGFVQGKVAYTINGDWALQEFQTALGDDLGVAELPMFDGQLLYPYFGSHVLALPGKNMLSQAAFSVIEKLMNELLSPDFQAQLWQQAKLQPVIEGVAESIQDPNLHLIHQQLKSGSYMPEFAAMTVVWAGLSTGLSRYLAGILTEKEASQFMQQIIEKSLREQQRDPINAN